MIEAKRNSIVDKYGITNIIIAVLCVAFLIINSILVSEAALEQLSSNKYVAYLLNFLAGCEGILGTYGSMSKSAVFYEGQWWRLITHIYLHAGVLHMAFNVFALLFAGKVVKQKIGSFQYVLLFHAIAVLNAIILCMIFPNSTSVGASAGIFGMIGFVSVLKLNKDRECNVLLKKGESVYIIVFSLLSLVLGLESFTTHFIAFILGLTVGFIFLKLKLSKTT